MRGAPCGRRFGIPIRYSEERGDKSIQGSGASHRDRRQYRASPRILPLLPIPTKLVIKKPLAFARAIPATIEESTRATRIRMPERHGIVPGEKFADNNRELVALRGIMLHASVCAAGAAVPLRVLSAFLLFQVDFGLKGHGVTTCGMESGACAMA